MTKRRLERAAAFVARLHKLSRTARNSWRRAESVGRDVGPALEPTFPLGGLLDGKRPCDISAFQFAVAARMCAQAPGV